MGFEYATRDDMRMRLNGSIVRYDGEYYIVNMDSFEAKEWYHVHLVCFNKEGSDSKPKYFHADHRDKKFDPLSPKIGYLNYSNDAYYPMRTPERRQIQGLNSSSLTWEGGRPNGNYFSSEHMYNMLHNRYPKMQEALDDIINRDKIKVAIHPDYAIGWMDPMKIGLFRKGRIIGYRDSNIERFIIMPSKESSFITKQLSKERILND